VAIRHFTSAWVVQALAGAGKYRSIPTSRLHSALRIMWARYESRMGLWAWGNGDLPIWMTLDAVTALHVAALTMADSPVGPPGDG
jgi:hypothetical protein